MPTFSRDYKRDLAEVERAIKEGEAFCLVRFNDGEHALLHGQTYKAASGWRYKGTRKGKKTQRPLWLQGPLAASLAANLPGYCVGISAPCCLPKLVFYYRRAVQVAADRVTYASLFFNSNYPRALRFFHELDAIKVGPKGCDYQVPADGVNRKWDIDALVDKLLEEADRPILLAAGPSACIIGHRYWERGLERQTKDPGFRIQSILDVGAVLDTVIHKQKTRTYHDSGSPLRGHVCRWEAGLVRSGLAPASVQKQGHIVTRGHSGATSMQQQVINHGPTASAVQVRELDQVVRAQAAPRLADYYRQRLTPKPRGSGAWTKKRARVRRKKR